MLTDYQLAIAKALWKAAEKDRIPAVWIDAGRVSIATDLFGSRERISWDEAARMVGMEPERKPGKVVKWRKTA